MPCVDGRTDPALWARAKKAAMARACRKNKARCDGWDARMAQDAGRIYRDEGGGYCGVRTARQKSLTKWTREDWTTATGKTACEWRGGRKVCDRYLPAHAWEALTPAQKRATRQRKKAAREKFVPNAPAAKRAGQAARQEFAGLFPQE